MQRSAAPCCRRTFIRTTLRGALVGLAVRGTLICTLLIGLSVRGTLICFAICRLLICFPVRRLLTGLLLASLAFRHDLTGLFLRRFALGNDLGGFLFIGLALGDLFLVLALGDFSLLHFFCLLFFQPLLLLCLATFKGLFGSRVFGGNGCCGRDGNQYGEQSSDDTHIIL